MALLEKLVPVFVGVAVIGLATWVDAALPQMRIVAASDVELPDGTEASPEIYSVGVDGDTAFLTTRPGGDPVVTLVHEIDKVPEVVIRTGDPSPSGEGTVFGIGSFHMSQARFLFVVDTSAGESLLLTHDGTDIRSAFQEWYPGLGYFDLAATNPAGDALLRLESSTAETLGFVRVSNGPEGVGSAIPIVDNDDPVPGATAGLWTFPSSDQPAYIADDGAVVFESGYIEANVGRQGVFFMLANSSTLERVDPPFPGTPTGTEVCCNLLGVDKGGHIVIAGSRDGEEYLFAGNPQATNLALTIPAEGLAIPNAAGLTVDTFDVPTHQASVGDGGSLLWTTSLQGEPGLPWGLLTYEAGTGVRLLAKQGDPAPEGGSFGGNFTRLVTNGKGGFQFVANGQLYRATRVDSDAVPIELLAGQGQSFEGPDGTLVTADQIESQLDARAYEAGRIALTVFYTDTATNTPKRMVLVDGTPLPRPPEKSGRCQVTDLQPNIASLGALGLLLLLIRRRRDRPTKRRSQS